MSTPKRQCVYCDAPTKKGGKGEHIIPDAIGGARTLNHGSGRVVCTQCNNEDLGEIDKEFASKSYLSIVSSQEIASFLSLSWNIDHAADNLLVESKPIWKEGLLADMICYPQLTFEKKGGVNIRGDAREMEEFGNDSYYRVLTRAAKAAFQKYQSTGKGIHKERIESFMEDGNVRLAPRLFTRERIATVANKIEKTSFILRYVNEEDWNLALKGLNNLNQEQNFPNRKFVPGSLSPRVSCSFNVGLVIRGLMKIGVNLIAAYCPSTPVDPKHFEIAISQILGKYQPSLELINSNGFIPAEMVADIAAADKAHSFRLLNMNGVWRIWSSFFGGRVGTYSEFPGPNKEEWNTLDITAPLRSINWRTRPSNLYVILPKKVQWEDSGNLCPSLHIQTTKAKMRAELVPIKPRKPRKNQG